MATRSGRRRRPRPRRPGRRPALAGLARRSRRAGAARRGGKLALKEVGEFEHPTYVAGAPGYPRLLFVVEQAGRVDRAERRQAGRPAVPRHPLAGRLRRRRARPALDRLPARLQGERTLLRLLRQQGRLDRDRRIPPRRARPGRRPEVAAHRDHDPAPGQRQPQRRADAVPRRRPLLRHRRRRRGRRPAEQRAEQGRAARQAAADRPAAGRRQALHGPRLEPVRRRRRSRRDLQLRLAQSVPLQLRLGHRSDANRGSRSAMSARTTSRRSTTRRSPPPAAPTSAGTRSRASTPTKKKTPGRPTPAARRSRSSPTPTPATAAAR